MKPIFLSEEDKAKMLEEFKDQLDKESLFDGTLKFERKWTYNDTKEERAVIIYTPEAYLKTIQLIKEFNGEVAWHCLVERGDEGEYIIYDVLVYPQEVTGVTVNTDQQEYTQFLMDLTDDEANAMHVQCHSHVMMSTNPSSVDLNHQSQIVQSLRSGFYIFQIWNKKLETTSVIYDIDNNIVYENKDIDIEVSGENGFMSEFIDKCKEIVKERKWSASKTNLPSNAYSAKSNAITPHLWADDEYEDMISDYYGYGKNGYYGKETFNEPF